MGDKNPKSKSKNAQQKGAAKQQKANNASAKQAGMNKGAAVGGGKGKK